LSPALGGDPGCAGYGGERKLNNAWSKVRTGDPKFSVSYDHTEPADIDDAAAPAAPAAPASPTSDE